ncbi:MAG: hypoxanthine phosphoribosyltransferase [Acidimicrobiia bacterium]|nr:hypoxanthine phosphoribosyltransferase [Acidimicrobiia bacterium]NNC76118.1 hypoxanthine phosphoribosyltransferase [Acidimicrobiia bacterium]
MTSPFVEVVSRSSLRERVDQLGAEISTDLKGEVPVMVGVLQGSVVFLADLVRSMTIDLEVEFLSLTRFGHDGQIGIAMDIADPLEDRHVVIVEDIVDTGLTLASMRRLLEVRNPASIRTVTLIDKAPRRIVEVDLEYRGFEVGDEFLLGYGLDWKGHYRHISSLWAVMDLEVLQENRLAFAQHLGIAP